MGGRRTDLAMEAKELWEESARETSELPGVIAREETGSAGHITSVEIINEEGEKALGKPKGRYITLEVADVHKHGRGEHISMAEMLAGQLRSLLPLREREPVLVCGLGNRTMTPDAIGPKTVDSVLVTRHLISGDPKHFGVFRPVSALALGVLGDTGVESGEMIRGVADTVRPDCIIAVDALASRSVRRLFRSIQLTDTGIVPGSGVGNHRMALNRESMGVPVVAVGVPTVVDAGTLCMDLLGEEGYEKGKKAGYVQEEDALFVTPKDVDRLGATLSKILDLGIILAVHENLSAEDVEMFLS